MIIIMVIRVFVIKIIKLSNMSPHKVSIGLYSILS